jgi:hypothetical protein
MADVDTDEVSWLVVGFSAWGVFAVHVLLIMAPQLVFRVHKPSVHNPSVHKPSVRQARVLSVCNCLAGGVFLAASLLGQEQLCKACSRNDALPVFTISSLVANAFHKTGLLSHAQSLERKVVEYVRCVARTHFPD